APQFHLAEDAFPLHLLFQGFQRLVDVVVANDDLQRLLRVASRAGLDIRRGLACLPSSAPGLPAPQRSPGQFVQRLTMIELGFDRWRRQAHINAMAILKIARMGHPVLARKADPVPNPTAPAIQQLVRHMIETMIDANGAGLAAPQVHVPLRLAVFQAPEARADQGLSEAERYDHTAPLTVLISPEIEIMGPEMEGGWEGCLSIPGMRGYVERPAHIRYRGVD